VAVAAVEGTHMAPTKATTNSACKAAAVEGRAPAQRAAVQGGQSLCHQAGQGPVQYLFRRGPHLLSHYFNKNNLD